MHEISVSYLVFKRFWRLALIKHSDTKNSLKVLLSNLKLKINRFYFFSIISCDYYTSFQQISFRRLIKKGKQINGDKFYTKRKKSYYDKKI